MALSATGIIPGVYRDILEAGEEASRLEMVLSRVAEMAERETELALKNFMAVFVPLLTVALGGFVAGIIASVMLALLSANDLVLQKEQITGHVRERLYARRTVSRTCDFGAYDRHDGRLSPRP